MGINFCKYCKSLLNKVNDNWICISCKSQSKEQFSLSTIENIEDNRDVPIIIEKDSEVLPITEFNCSRCNNDQAYFWHMITTASDEADTIFHRCTMCGLTVQKGGQRGGR
jgi:transcription factor S